MFAGFLRVVSKLVAVGNNLPCRKYADLEARRDNNTQQYLEAREHFGEIAEELPRGDLLPFKTPVIAVVG